MKSVLEQINGVPEVIGSMVCGSGAEPLAHLFPPLFDENIIRLTCESLRGARLWEGKTSGSDGLIDFRYTDGRIIGRTLERGFILILCTRGVNLSLLNISLNVACKRLDELMKHVQPDTPQPERPHTGGEGLSSPGPANLLFVDELDTSTEAGKGFQELGLVAVTSSTLQRLSTFFSLPTLKRVRLTHGVNGNTGMFGLIVFNDDSGRYDGAIIISRHVEKKLLARKGDTIRVDPA